MCFQGREAGQGQSEVEKLQQENEALKTQMARLSTQLLDVGHGADLSPFYWSGFNYHKYTLILIINLHLGLFVFSLVMFTVLVATFVLSLNLLFVCFS